MVIGAFIAFVAVQTVIAGSKVITENEGEGAPFLLFGNGQVDATKLKSEGDSRINILIMGKGGSNHPGGNLADTIEVASIDPQNKTAGLVSIPRDLLISIPGAGNGKINTVFTIGEQKKKGGGAELTKKVISEMLDMPIHYYIDIDFQGFTKIIDSFGGVTVNVENGFTDYQYPDERMVGYAPFTA